MNIPAQAKSGLEWAIRLWFPLAPHIRLSLLEGVDIPPLLTHSLAARENGGCVVELPDPMEDIRRLSDFAEAEEMRRGQREEASRGESRVMKLLTLCGAGAVITVVRLLFSGEPWLELAWRVLLGAAVVWLPTTLLVLLFGAGGIQWKKALWMGALPSLAALVALASPVILLLILIVILLLIAVRVLAYPIMGGIWVYDRLGSISRRLKNGSN